VIWLFGFLYHDLLTPRTALGLDMSLFIMTRKSGPLPNVTFEPWYRYVKNQVPTQAAQNGEEEPKIHNVYPENLCKNLLSVFLFAGQIEIVLACRFWCCFFLFKQHVILANTINQTLSTQRKYANEQR
jgi:hypothetical protein